MAKINFTNLGFTPSAGAVTQRLRMFPAGSTPSAAEVYAAPFADVGNDGVVDEAEISGVGGANAEGNFDLYLTAVDAAGNESDYAVKANYPLDLVAPAAPVWL
jgi:hypothetical protein